MSKILNLDDMLDIAQELDVPGYADLIEQIETAASAIADASAAALCVHVSSATWEGSAFAGLCATFTPAFEGQECPELIDQADTGGDWE